MAPASVALVVYTDLESAVAQMKHDGIAGAEPAAEERHAGHLLWILLLRRDVLAGLQQVLRHVAAEVLEERHLLLQRVGEYVERVEVLVTVSVDVLHVTAKNNEKQCQSPTNKQAFNNASANKWNKTTATHSPFSASRSRVWSLKSTPTLLSQSW